MVLTDKKNRTSEYETKYLLENLSAPKILKWLELRCCKDPLYPENTVSSIYYDTRDWFFLREKINGDYLKTKVRVRWYSDLDNRNAVKDSFLEIKRKTGNSRNKKRIKTDITGTTLSGIKLKDKILNDILILLKESGNIFPDHLFPCFQISYKRNRFIEPVSGIRLSLDYDIRVPKVNTAQIQSFNNSYLNSAVFEIKGNIHRLPAFINQLTSFGCLKDTCSKYYSCYEKIMRIQV